MKVRPGDSACRYFKHPAPPVAVAGKSGGLPSAPGSLISTPCLLLMLAAMQPCLTSCFIPVPVAGKELVAPAVSGTVVDAATTRPVAGATVMWSKLSDTKTVTDDTGFFKIRAVQDAYYFRVLHPGGYGNIPVTRPPASELEASHPDYRSTTTSVLQLEGDHYRVTSSPIRLKLRRM